MWFICRKGFQTHPSRGLQPHVLMFIFFLGGKLFVKQIARGWCHCLRHPELTARCLCHNCWRWRWLHSPIAGAFLGSEAEGWEIHLQGSPELMEVEMPDRCWEPVDFERLGNIKSLICPYLFFDSAMKHMKHRRGFDFVALKSKKSTTTFSICIGHAEAQKQKLNI